MNYLHDSSYVCNTLIIYLSYFLPPNTFSPLSSTFLSAIPLSLFNQSQSEEIESTTGSSVSLTQRTVSDLTPAITQSPSQQHGKTKPRGSVNPSSNSKSNQKERRFSHGGEENYGKRAKHWLIEANLPAHLTFLLLTFFSCFIIATSINFFVLLLILLCRAPYRVSQKERHPNFEL